MPIVRVMGPPVSASVAFSFSESAANAEAARLGLPTVLAFDRHQLGRGRKGEPWKNGW
jgi:hypothetical protein